MKFASGLTAAVLGLTLVSAPAAVAAPMASAQASSQVQVLSVSRQELIDRAKTWHPHTDQRVPYSQSGTHGGYRTDCSGYVAMAAKLAAPGPNTVGLASSTHTTAISVGEMKMGDLFIDSTGDSNTRHVVIFEKWVDSAHSSYWAYEQRGSYGTDHRTLTYGLKGGEYKPRRLKVVTG
ncbi:hypothetical protein [Umezawaea sp. Da 62-37]|uniref:hypothetical protein n=1 Tax=Umezawaea sp. Da 62-37 TaxID=3075927 RepID=UPI0028F71B26|nr:hypothetical protein [Umezawaea sp. Da 62-37]WNV83958.1 hypothetical protein RM788_38210 [Umezawaea sp. Da 62-37]